MGATETVRVLWVSPETGKCSETPVDGWERVPLEGEVPWYERLEGDELLEYYAKTMRRADAREEGLRAEYGQLIADLEAQLYAQVRQVEAKRRTVEWLIGKRVRKEVESRLAKSTKKSLDTKYARLGYRRCCHVDVFDEVAAVAYAERHAPHAVRRSIRRGELDRDEVRSGAVSGVSLVEHEKFYCRRANGGSR